MKFVEKIVYSCLFGSVLVLTLSAWTLLYTKDKFQCALENEHGRITRQEVLCKDAIKSYVTVPIIRILLTALSNFIPVAIIRCLPKSDANVGIQLLQLFLALFCMVASCWCSYDRNFHFVLSASFWTPFPDKVPCSYQTTSNRKQETTCDFNHSASAKMVLILAVFVYFFAACVLLLAMLVVLLRWLCAKLWLEFSDGEEKIPRRVVYIGSSSHHLLESVAVDAET